MSHRLAVYVVLREGSDVMFMLRSGTGYRDGQYGLPSGKVEQGESLIDAARREVVEETGLALRANQLILGHVMERVTTTGRWIDWFFVADEWDGQPTNREPWKCGGFAWLRPDHETISDYVRLALRAIADGQPFSVYHGV